MPTIFDYIEVTHADLKSQTDEWIQAAYNKAGILLDSASPYGQLLGLQREFFEHTMLYVKNSVRNLGVEDSNNEKVIRSMARLSGHNASRPVSATGTLRLKLKPGVNVQSEIAGGQIVINDKTRIKNKTNTLFYSIVLGTAQRSFDVAPGTELYVNVVQGRFDSEDFTGTGEVNQSFSVQISSTAKIDNFNYTVAYNGQILKERSGVFDMLPYEPAYFARTGMDGGLDIYFGNGAFGFTPQTGTVITVSYLLTDGTAGNIPNPVPNDFTFIDPITDGEGSRIQPDNLFDVTVATDIGFSSNGESVQFTKSVMPYISRNFVLSTPDQFIFHLRRLNMFSKVDAYVPLDDFDQSNDNRVYLYLVPDISGLLGGDVNYFNLPAGAFYLDDEEKTKVLTYLRRQGIISATTVVQIVQPTISRYVINVFVRRFDDTTEEDIRGSVISTCSSFFTSNTRTDRAVKSELISRLKGIRGMDSVNLTFVSKKNEDYHKRGGATTGRAPRILEQPYVIEKGKLYVKEPYDPKAVLGIDSVQGDIIVDRGELAILRGGWYDRNDTYYEESPKDSSLGPINISFGGVTPRKSSN